MRQAYLSVDALVKWHTAPNWYYTLTRLIRFGYAVPAIVLHSAITTVDYVCGTALWAPESWTLKDRLQFLIIGHFLWVTNPGVRTPHDETSYSARTQLVGKSDSRRIELVEIQPSVLDDKLFGITLDPAIKPERCPAFWQWNSAHTSPRDSTVPKNSQRVIMYLVGGGYIQGHPGGPSPLAWKVTQATGVPVFGVNFRKASSFSNAFPAALIDAVAGFYYLLSQGYESQNISFMGDSAGGGLVITTVLYLLRYKLMLPGKIILVSPFVDMVSTFSVKKDEKRLQWTDIINPEMLSVSGYLYTLNRPDLRSTLLSPSLDQLPDGYSFAGFPKTSLTYGTAELFSPSNVKFAQLLKAAKVEISEIPAKDQVHVYPYFTNPAKDAYYAHLSSFLQ